MPQTLKSPVFSELIVKKSRFLAWVEPVESSEAAKARIESIRQEYPDARHVCHAFYVNGSSGMSDDGEPSGTAGKPMFNVLAHKHLENVIAIVVRYFGGIKLGAGGLTRAYGGAVSQAVEEAEFVTIEALRTIELECPFALESNIRRVAALNGIELENVQYSQTVNAQITVKDSKALALLADLQAVAPGNADLVVRLVD